MEREIPVAAPRINIEASIRDLLHEVRLVQACLDAQIDRLEQIERALKTLLGARTAHGGGIVDSGAAQVAYNLQIVPHADESVEVTIDGGRKFSLGPRLAKVFLFLATGEKDRGGADPLVGWRSRTEIIKFLKDSTGKDFRRTYLNNMVHLLKQALRKAGYDCSLIQTHRQKGARLAFKRGAHSLSGASTPGW